MRVTSSGARTSRRQRRDAVCAGECGGNVYEGGGCRRERCRGERSESHPSERDDDGREAGAGADGEQRGERAGERCEQRADAEGQARDQVGGGAEDEPQSESHAATARRASQPLLGSLLAPQLLHHLLGRRHAAHQPVDAAASLVRPRQQLAAPPLPGEDAHAFRGRGNLAPAQPHVANLGSGRRPPQHRQRRRLAAGRRPGRAEGQTAGPAASLSRLAEDVVRGLDRRAGGQRPGQRRTALLKRDGDGSHAGNRSGGEVRGLRQSGSGQRDCGVVGELSDEACGHMDAAGQGRVRRREGRVAHGQHRLGVVVAVRRLESRRVHGHAAPRSAVAVGDLSPHLPLRDALRSLGPLLSPLVHLCTAAEPKHALPLQPPLGIDEPARAEGATQVDQSSVVSRVGWRVGVEPHKRRQQPAEHSRLAHRPPFIPPQEHAR
mmetsp:Transcript_38402/g.120962  ORF Transcript_38402/g.120962 Transcript_38402/m.120962 type:complete len:435 (-) Transcript_38402:346-1650(-)